MTTHNCNSEAPTDVLLTVEQVAQHYGVTRSTVYGWIKADERPLPAVRLGGVWRISTADLTAWIKSETAAALSGPGAGSVAAAASAPATALPDASAVDAARRQLEAFGITSVFTGGASHGV